MGSSSEPLAVAPSNSGTANAAIPPIQRSRFVRSRKRFKVYTWKYKKTITPVASFILIVNQIFGFGMNSIPSIFAQGGLLNAVLANLVIWVMACLCSLMLLKAMTFLPHNNNFQQRIEYNSLVKYYLSDAYFKIISFLHYIGDFCTIVCGIVTFSKLVDMILIKAVGFTLMLRVYPSLGLDKVGPDLFLYIYETTDATRPLGVMGITLGYLVCALICTRLSCTSLEETTKFHVTSFLILLGCSVQLCMYSVFSLKGQGWRAVVGRSSPVSPLGSFSGSGVGTEPTPRLYATLKDRLKTVTLKTRRFLQILLTFVDNYSVASTLPSWANEMTNDVKPTRTLWLSSFFAFAMYLVLGLLFSKSFLKPGSTSILDDILNGSHSMLVNCSISLFVVMTCIPDVVFGCISLRYNLMNLGYFTTNQSYFWGCVFPFLFTWVLLNDKMFQGLIGTLGLLSALVCDFFVPVLLYILSHTKNYSDFIRPRELSKLELFIQKLVRLYKTVRHRAASICRRTVRHKVFDPFRRFRNAYRRFVDNKLLAADPSGTRHSDLPEELFKSNSSTTISSASDGSYNRRNTGISTSSRGLGAFGRFSTVDGSEFSTFSSFLSGDSFLFGRRALTRLSQTLSFSSFRRSLTSFFESRGSGFSNFSRGSSGTEQGDLSKPGSLPKVNDSWGARFYKSISCTFGMTFSNRFINRSNRFSKKQSSTKFSELSDILSKPESTNLSSYAPESSIDPPQHLGSSTGPAKGLSVSFSKGPSTVLNFEKYEAMDSEHPNTPISDPSPSSAAEKPARTFSGSLATGLRNTSSLTRSLRKSISANFAKNISKNFGEATEVEFGSSIESFQGNSRSSSVDHERFPSIMSSTSSISAAESNVAEPGKLGGVKEGASSSTAAKIPSKPVASVGAATITPTEAGPMDLDNFVDYKSFKITKYNNEPTRTDDNLFNALNRPASTCWPRSLDQSIAPRSRSSSFSDYKTCVCGTPPQDATSLTLDREDERGMGSLINRKSKRDRDAKRPPPESFSRARLVVFPRFIERCHLQIAKVMMVAIGALTCALPGIHPLR